MVELVGAGLYSSIFIEGNSLSLVVWNWCLRYREEHVEKEEGRRRGGYIAWERKAVGESERRHNSP